MVTRAFVEAMPKVELHVHLEGAIRPETVLKLAERNGVELPARDLVGLREWYRFRDFSHFVEIYVAVSNCIRNADDLELIAREFIEGQAQQNVLYTEATYTAMTIANLAGIPWPEQREALRRAVAWGEAEHEITVRFILDIVRGAHDAAVAMEVAEWAISAPDLVVALGLAGKEGSVPASTYAEAFAIAHANGLPVVPHAGETVGPESIREALDVCRPARIQHGVRCLEDPNVAVTLRDSRMPLDVTPTSNLRLGVYPSLAEHPLPRLLDEGLMVTVGSDDPPMFGTTITDELFACATEFGFSEDILWTLTLNAANGALLAPEAKRALIERLRDEWPDKDEEA